VTTSTQDGPHHHRIALLIIRYETRIEDNKRWQRTQLPDSPFTVMGASGKWHAYSSTVRVEWAEDAHDKPQIIDPNDDLPDDVPCGSMVYIRPQVIALDGA
jgi:hypothetical protein